MYLTNSLANMRVFAMCMQSKYELAMINSMSYFLLDCLWYNPESDKPQNMSKCTVIFDIHRYSTYTISGEYYRWIPNITIHLDTCCGVDNLRQHFWILSSLDKVSPAHGVPVSLHILSGYIKVLVPRIWRISLMVIDLSLKPLCNLSPYSLSPCNKLVIQLDSRISQG